MDSGSFQIAHSMPYIGEEVVIKDMKMSLNTLSHGRLMMENTIPRRHYSQLSAERNKVEIGCTQYRFGNRICFRQETVRTDVPRDRTSPAPNA